MDTPFTDAQSAIEESAEWLNDLLLDAADPQRESDSDEDTLEQAQVLLSKSIEILNDTGKIFNDEEGCISILDVDASNAADALTIMTQDILSSVHIPINGLDHDAIRKIKEYLPSNFESRFNFEKEIIANQPEFDSEY